MPRRRRAASAALALCVAAPLAAGLAAPAGAGKPRTGLTEFPARLQLAAVGEGCGLDDSRRWAGAIKHNGSEQIGWSGAVETGEAVLDLDVEQRLTTRRQGRWSGRATVETWQRATPDGDGVVDCAVALSSGTSVEATRDLGRPGWARVLVESSGDLATVADVLLAGRRVDAVEAGDGTVLVPVEAGEVTVRLSAGHDLVLDAGTVDDPVVAGGEAAMDVTVTPYGGSPARQRRVSGGPYLHLPGAVDCDSGRLVVRPSRGERRKLARAVLTVGARKAIGRRKHRSFSVPVEPGESITALLFVKQRSGKRAELERSYLPCS